MHTRLLHCSSARQIVNEDGSVDTYENGRFRFTAPGHPLDIRFNVFQLDHAALELDVRDVRYFKPEPPQVEEQVAEEEGEEEGSEQEGEEEGSEEEDEEDGGEEEGNEAEGEESEDDGFAFAIPIGD